MINVTRLLLSASVLALCACGGGTTAPSSTLVPRAPAPPASPPPPPGPAPAPLQGGSWYGTLVNDVSGTSSDITMLVSEDGRFHFLWLDFENWQHSGALMSGEIIFSADSFTGSGRAYTATGVTWSDASTASDLLIAGSISRSNTSAAAWTGTWSTASGDSGSFVSGPVPFNFGGSGSQLNHLAGTWVANDYARDDAAWATLTIGADGGFSGEDSQGCVYFGQVGTVDTRSSVYNVENNVTDCDIAGAYSGIAIRDGWYGTVYISVDDGARPMLLMLLK